LLVLSSSAWTMSLTSWREGNLFSLFKDPF